MNNGHTTKAAALWLSRTRECLQELGVAHLAFPHSGQSLLHALEAPQKVEYAQVEQHVLLAEDGIDGCIHVVLPHPHTAPSCRRVRIPSVNVLLTIPHTSRHLSLASTPTHESPSLSCQYKLVHVPMGSP